jgi:hypothetical protein
MGRSNDFFQGRADYLTYALSDAGMDYLADVFSEFEKLTQVSPGDEVNLWFEYDLFCQANMWFTLCLLPKGVAVFRVSPVTLANENKWDGFGKLAKESLRNCFESRERFSDEDLNLGLELWGAFSTGDLATLEKLSQTGSRCYPFLQEVCAAEIARKKEHRPEMALAKIVANGATDFSDVFAQFAATESIYGFGDLQVKNMLKKQDIYERDGRYYSR